MPGIDGAGRFNVSIGHFRGIDLAKKDDSETSSSPYLMCNWDNFHKFRTDAIPKSSNPVWSEEENFEFPTRFLNKLGRKTFTVECISKKKNVCVHKYYQYVAGTIQYILIHIFS